MDRRSDYFSFQVFVEGLKDGKGQKRPLKQERELTVITPSAHELAAQKFTSRDPELSALMHQRQTEREKAECRSDRGNDGESIRPS